LYGGLYERQYNKVLSFDPEVSPQVSVGETLPALAKLKAAGKIRCAGLRAGRLGGSNR
jgi:aryl-alcohol dehydrogenase-like predicted oxidoreductase